MGVQVDCTRESTNKLTLTFSITQANGIQKLSYTSPNYFCGVNCFQVMIANIRYANQQGEIEYNAFIHVRLSKILKQDTLLYICKVFSESLKITDFSFTDYEKWFCCHTRPYKCNIYSTDPLTLSFDLSATIDVAPSVNPFAKLYDDTELTDFELHCNKDKVSVHKTVLAATSPVFYKMLSGKWKETKEGHVEIPNTTIQTLNHLKEYMYLHQLPEKDIESLIVLGLTYSMPDLVKSCSVMLINKLTADNVLEIVKFALKFEVSILLWYIFKNIQNGVLDVDKIPALAEWNKV